jgi:putative peptidoglycan lipid II flippase
LLREPVVALLFQRGEFGPDDTQLVAWALLWFTAGLVGHCVVEIASRAFYAMQDTRTPVLVGTGAMALNVVLSFTLPGLFANAGLMPHGGLALANSAATFLEMLVLLFLMSRRLGGLEPGSLSRGFIQAAAGSLLMGFAIWGWISLPAQMPAWFLAISGIGVGLGVYVLVAWLLRVPELSSTLSAVRARLKRG